ncbi:MAG: alpha/beta hydrolase [Tetrasphaera sp.]
MGTVSGLARIGMRGVPALVRSGVAGVAKPLGTALQGLPVAPVRVWQERIGPDIPLGSLLGVESTVETVDGLHLYVSTDPPEGPVEQDLTLVFLHGYLENLHYWHYQRIAFRGRVRALYYDARGHGKSPVGEQPITIDLLVEDLRRVIESIETPGPLVLIGHSLGGMTLLGLARRHPELVKERVAGVGLIATSANMVDYDIGLRRFGGALWKVAPSRIDRGLKNPGLRAGVTRFRGLIGALESEAVREIAFASAVSPELLQFTAEMIGEAKIETSIGDLLRLFGSHDVTEALANLQHAEAAVVTGDRDVILQVEHSEAIARGLPKALFSVVPRGGHLVSLEHPEVVNPHLFGLVQRVRYRLIINWYRSGGRPADEPREGRR